MKCPNCGAENSDSVSYCEKCAYEFEMPGVTEPKLPTLWILGALMCIVGIVLMALCLMGAVTGLMAGPILAIGAALFLAGLISWRVFHSRQ